MADLRDRLEALAAELETRPCSCAGDVRALLEPDDAPSGHIIVAGRSEPVSGAVVRTWLDHGLTFDTEHAPHRTKPIRWGVLHWTGGGKREGLAGAKTIHRTLNRRGLSVEFAITDEGTIWQFVDPVEQRCRHASRLNEISLGVEVSGPGWIARNLLPTRHLGRERYRATVHGWTTTFLDYVEAQQRAVNALATALAEAGLVHPSVVTEPFERRRSRFFQSSKGWCGHLHCAHMSVKHPKCDPGPAPLKALERRLLELGLSPEAARYLATH
jgi:hypothetical protein